MDWFDPPENANPSAATGASRMRLYIVVGLAGLGALGGLLHLLPA